MTTTQLPAKYRQAVEIIKTNGWHQGGFADPSAAPLLANCRVCMAGALRLAVTGHPVQSQGSALLAEAERFLADRLASTDRPYSEPVSVIGIWNDRSYRTVEQVIEALERAAVAAESGGAA